MAAKVVPGRGRVTVSTPGPLYVIRLSGWVGRRRGIPYIRMGGRGAASLCGLVGRGMIARSGAMDG